MQPLLTLPSDTCAQEAGYIPVFRYSSFRAHPASPISAGRLGEEYQWSTYHIFQEDYAFISS